MSAEPRPRIVYIGAERVGLACLQRLCDLGKNVVGVITAEDGLRERIADWAPFDDLARERGLALHKVRSTRSPEIIELVRGLAPDLICVVSWSMIVPSEILELPARGVVGFHYAMLPRRRGGAPLNWAIIDGLTETGITLFYLDEGVDTGDIIDQQSVEICPGDTVRDLLDKILKIAPDLLARRIDGIEAGTAPRALQLEADATYTPRRTPADGEIDWSKPDREIYDFVRALASPYSNAFTTLGGRRLVIPSARLSDGRLHVEAYLE